MNEIWIKVNVQTEAIQMFSGFMWKIKLLQPGAESNDVIHVHRNFLGLPNLYTHVCKAILFKMNELL